MSLLNVADIVKSTLAEGPGNRYVIWVQGCLKRCPGCCNVEMLKLEMANIISSEEIIADIKETMQQHQLEGVTFLGGEPALQAQGLGEIAQACQELGLSVMMFTGYLLEELQEDKFKGISKLLKHLDLLIDGEYLRDQQETVRNWVGSTNQRFHYLSDFYDSSIETAPQAVTNEFRISLDGTVEFNGLPIKVANLK